MAAVRLSIQRHRQLLGDVSSRIVSDSLERLRPFADESLHIAEAAQNTLSSENSASSDSVNSKLRVPCFRRGRAISSAGAVTPGLASSSASDTGMGTAVRSSERRRDGNSLAHSCRSAPPSSSSPPFDASFCTTSAVKLPKLTSASASGSGWARPPPRLSAPAFLDRTSRARPIPRSSSSGASLAGSDSPVLRRSGDSDPRDLGTRSVPEDARAREVERCSSHRATSLVFESSSNVGEGGLLVSGSSSLSRGEASGDDSGSAASSSPAAYCGCSISLGGLENSAAASCLGSGDSPTSSGRPWAPASMRSAPCALSATAPQPVRCSVFTPDSSISAAQSSTSAE
mmetsp:Transcript_36568/g.91908  ORF Transcript_36568/g.91908 Transcript_36568/m.91908 type:complete len:343 (+) Transcript_36568:192-1220(+)